MSPSTGLRFDVYERVHLPDDTASIKELTGVELTPDIRVITKGEQALLKGHLFLSGTFESIEEGRGEQQLSHRIPVEITLPLNRVRNVNDIQVEIENFDVELLSNRSLNVTGVLSLEGIEMLTDGESVRSEEEMVFSHRTEPAAEAPPEEQPSAAEVRVEPADAAVEPAPEAPSAPPPEKLLPLQEPVEIGEEPNENPNAEVPEENANAPAAEFPALTPPPEKQEIKIAFAGKQAESAGQTPLGVNEIMSMASGGSALPRNDAEQQQAKAVEESPETKDRLEWKRLFLSAGKDEQSFRRVKMCIAQKEDTIETIADRYAKSARELMLYNRLSDQYLREGQVVYIP